MSVKVSIIVPVYNVAPYLEACMKSLCNQTLKDIEIIVINDNSTDNSLEILKNFAQKDARVKIINNSINKKTASARNAGLAIACGEYVGFVDGDDYIDLDFCEKLYSLAVKNNADIAKGMTRIIGNDGKFEIINDNKNIVKNGKFAFWGRLWTAIYRKKMLEEYNVSFHVDFFCFQIQAIYYANKIVCADDTFYDYVRHENSCDSDIFTIEKWQRLNLGHANFVYDWVKSHSYEKSVENFYFERIKDLYFYGFNKLAKNDILEGCKILAETLKNKYNCGYNISNTKALQRKLYKLNKNTTILGYFKNIITGAI